MALCKIRPELPVLKDKDINVVRSLVKDSSWIVAAVDNLRVVEKFLKDEEFEEDKKSSISINNIISCLKTLDNCRLKLHEELEIHSIRGFVMKQTYLQLPQQIREIIEGAVGRAKNEAERHYRKDKDEEDFLRADSIKMRQEILKLEAENSCLPQEQRKLEDLENEIIDDFNERLHHKLGLKEKLRKLREKIREENQNTVYTEAAILKMKEDLIVKRINLKADMKHYESKIEDMKKHRDWWLAKVETVKQEYTEVMTCLRGSDRGIENLKNNIQSDSHKMSTSSRLKGTYKQKMEQGNKMHNSLYEKKDRYLEELENIKEELGNNLSKKIQSNFELEMRIIFEKSAFKELEASEIEMSKEIEENALKDWRQQKDKLDALQDQFTRLEKELFDLMNEQTEQSDATEWIDSLLESRLMEMRLHIKTLIDTLNLKKKARIEIEEIQENVLKSIEEVKSIRDTFEAEYEIKLKQLHEQYKLKSAKVKQLQQHIRKTVTSIRVEIGEVKKVQDDYDEEFASNDDILKEIEENAVEQERILSSFSSRYQELTNPFKDVQVDYHNCLQTYTSIFRRQSYDKFLLNDLMSSTSNTEIELLKHQKKKKKMERSIKRFHEKYLKVLNKNHEETDKIEGEIYKQVCRLKFLKYENKFLAHELKDHEHQIEEIDGFNKEQSSLKTLLEEMIKKFRRGFIKKQRKIEEIEELAHQRDTPFLTQFNGVFDVMNFNIELVTSILNEITKEIKKFKTKWGNIKTMRP